MRQQEIQDEEERMRRRQEMSSSSRIIEPNEVGYISGTVPSSSESEEISSAQQQGGSAVTHPPGSSQNRDDEFDLENIMLMEAIWLSFQEDGKHHRNYGDASQLAKYAAELRVSAAVAPQAESTLSSSPFGGPECTMTSLAEPQQVGAESSTNSQGLPMYDLHPGHNGFSGREEGLELGRGYDDLNTVDDHDHGMYPLHDEIDMGAGGMIPESFEEQMMLAMAVSLSEARARTSSPEISWH